MTRQSTRRRTLLPASSGEPYPLSPYPLDVGTFSGFWSLRKISANATAAIRVQRSSDNAQQDIGFIGRELDIAGLLRFCTGSTGTITTWYDQSGNNKHLVQATVAAQPIIVNAGTLVGFAPGKPALQFDGTRYLACSTLTVILPLTHFAVLRIGAGTVIAGSTSTGVPHALTYASSGNAVKLNAFNVLTGPAVVIGNNLALSATADYNDSCIDVNPNFSRGLGGPNGIAGLEIGSWQGGTTKFVGLITEYALYGSISQNRKNKIGREQSAYYGVSYSTPAVPAYTAAYVFGGDSLTYGQNSTGLTNDWPSRFITKLASGTYFKMNTGFPGHTLVDMSTRANSESGLKNYFYPSVPTMLWVMGGTNDIIHDTVDATTAYTRLKLYVSSCAATGKFSTIGVCTLPATGYNSGGFATVVKAYNDLIRAGMQPGGDLLAIGATKLANLQSNPIFDDTPANVSTVTHNATYYNTVAADYTHLTDAGYDALAAIVAAVVS
jgi:lysophospholipase L1-like esterase